jgi:glucose-6-phosphate dehydrogenase assembly protein OpcA
MADALSMWRRSSGDAIERDLAALWRETAREGPLSRALMANLVMIQERDDPAGNAAGRESLAGAVAQGHPVRAILLDYTPGIETPGAPHAVRVGLRTFGSSTARYGVELIAIRAACPEASIPSIVSRLTRGGVPTAVWWLDDLSRNPPPEVMTTIGRQFLYDSASWRNPREGLRVVAGVLARPHAPDIADLNWRRLAPMRHAIVHGLRSAPAALELRATGVEIKHGASRTASALLLAGWLCGSLEWSSEDVPRMEEIGDSTDSFNATFSDGSWTVRLSMDDHRVRVTGTNQTPFEVLVPRETEAERVTAELRSLGADTALHTAVRAAAILAQ